MGFVLEPDEAQALIAKDPRNRDVLFPYLNGEDLNSRPDQSPSRWVINFHDWPLERAETYPDCMRIVREKVKPERDKVTFSKTAREKWWQFERRRPDLYSAIAKMQRVLVLTIVTQYLAPTFCATDWVYAHRCCVFPTEEGATFGVIQSSIHEAWARHHSSSLETRLNYSPSDCFENFAFPTAMTNLEPLSEQYYLHRATVTEDRQEGLTKIYSCFHNPAETSTDIARLRELHVEMDQAVAGAYCWTDLDLGHGFHETKQGVRFTISEAARREVLDRLLALNHERYAEEVRQGLHDKKGGKGKAAGKGKGKRRSGKGVQAMLWEGSNG